MSNWSDFQDETPENRRLTVKQNLARAGLSLDPTDARTLPGDTTSPDDIERRRRKAMEALQRHDAFWQVTPGCTISDAYKTKAPARFEAGDDSEARDD